MSYLPDSADNLLVARDLLRRALHQELAAVEHDNLVRDVHDDLHDVLDHQDRDAAGVDLADERGRVLPFDAGQAGHGLIEEEQLRL